MPNVTLRQCPIIIGSGYNGYGLVRSLGEIGISSIVVCGQKISPTRYSRYVNEAWSIFGNGLPSKRNREQILKKLARLNKPALLIPTDEVWTVELLDHSGEYAKYEAVPPFLSPQVTRLCLNKTDFILWCHNNGVLVPNTLSFLPGTNSENFLEDVSRLSFPVVVKPNTKGISDEGLGFHFYTIFPHYGDFNSWFKGFGDKGPASAIVVQEFIPGPVENLISMQGYIDRFGGFYGSQYVKLRQTKRELGCANMAYVQDRDGAVSDLTKTILLDKLQYRGFFDIEFKRHARNDKLFLIEINPRPGMLNYAATLMGMNLAAIALQDLSGAELHGVNFRPKLKPGWIWAKIIDDFLHELNDGLSISPSSPRHVLHKMRSWYAPYKQGVVVDPMWSLRDLKPGLVLLATWFVESARRSRGFLGKFLRI